MQTYEDEYEDYSEYEDEDEYDDEDEEEEAEERKPTKDEMEYLEFRQKLKERIRKNLKKDSGASGSKSSSLERKKQLPYNDFGSFFGPSQPVIASRVIQESKSLLENRHASMLLASNQGKKTVPSNGTISNKRPHDQLQPRPRPPPVSQVKRKVEQLKDTRDYSFLFSDDAELPGASKEDHPRYIPKSVSEAQSVQMPSRARQPMANSARNTHGSREEKRSVSANGAMHSKSGSSSSQHYSRSGPTNGRMPSNTGPTNGHTHSRMDSQKSAATARSNPALVDSRKQHGSNNGVGPGRPMGAKAAPPKNRVTNMEKKPLASTSGGRNPVSNSGGRNPVSNSQRPYSKTQSSDPRQQFQQNRASHESSRGKAVPKQSVEQYKPQPINRSNKQILSRDAIKDHRPKKKPMGMSEDVKALSMIRKMFNTDRYRGREFDDGDESDMEANFEDVMREEARSSRIARQEDEEQLRLIEEEERREERMRKMKKRKLSR